MDLVVVSDAWHPQVNGVVRTLDKLKTGLEARGWRVSMITPDEFNTLPCPTYPDIRLALAPGAKLARLMAAALPASIHIATEGPLGMAARAFCVKRRLPFTTAYHTRFPEYIHARTRLPLAISYKFMHWFHRPSSGLMVATPSLVHELNERGFPNIKRWTRGVDTDLFCPRDKNLIADPRPISMYVGRVATEKNIEAFLKLGLPGTKYVVGGGPQLSQLRRKYPDAKFVGTKVNGELAAYIASADVMVFPSLTDTFGLVILEAMASGVPVAAYDVTGPRDVIGDSGAGAVSNDLGTAVMAALEIPGERARQHALKYSWDVCIDQFAANLVAA
jgi:glycosyltransferase involved in cell wall biosynthesis